MPVHPARGPIVMHPSQNPDKSSRDPVKKMLAEQKPFSTAWLGSSRQSPIQRVGFILISIFCLLIGADMWWAFFTGPTASGLLVLGVGTLPLAIGVAGLVKAVRRH